MLSGANVNAQLSHREAQGLFLAALDQELPAVDEERLHQHLDDCVNCEEAWERYTRTVGQLQRLPREKAPQALSSVILRRVRRRRFALREVAQNQLAYRPPVEAIIPILLGVAVAVLLLLWAG